MNLSYKILLFEVIQFNSGWLLVDKAWTFFVPQKRDGETVDKSKDYLSTVSPH